MNGKGEYAKAGVDYTILQPFKEAMIATAKRTVTFPNARQVFIDTTMLHAHGGVFRYRGNQRHAWCKTQEGLGNKNWISELMYANNPSGPTYHDVIAYDNAMMAVNDCLAQGALPATYTDEVAASDSQWFGDERRSTDFARGLYEACKDAGMALVAGESPVYKWLINPLMPVKSAATFGGCVTGIIAPDDRLITGELLQPGSRIMGIASSGIHANGISAVIRRVMGEQDDDGAWVIKPQPNGFDTRLPSGMTVGEAVHIRTLCYVRLIERLLEREVPIHAILPGTGDGVAKLAFDKRNFRYRIHSWLKVPELFLWMREIGVPLDDCLKMFNWGVGYYIFVAPQHTVRVRDIAAAEGFIADEVGIVEEGERCTIFGPENDLELPPPGE